MKKNIFILMFALTVTSEASNKLNQNQTQKLFCDSALNYELTLERADILIANANSMTLNQAYMLDDVVNNLSSNLKSYVERFYSRSEKIDANFYELSRAFNVHRKTISQVIIPVIIFNGKGWMEAVEKYGNIPLVALDKKINSYYGIISPTHKMNVELAYSKIPQIKQDVAAIIDSFCSYRSIK